jgi:hypothetical protein
MRNAASLWLAAILSLFLFGDLCAQPRVRLPGADAQDRPLGPPTFDPYGSSGAADIPSPPTFGGGGDASGGSSRTTWFGFPVPEAGDGDSRQPLFSREWFTGDSGDGEGFFSGDAWSSLTTVRFRYTWLPGGSNPSSLDINDIDISLPIAVPDFMGSTQPWYLIPTFGLHLWDGPAVSADLPERAYSGVLDTYFRSDPTQRLGVELGVGVGIYTDFNTLTFHSLRVTGRGVVHLRLTPDTVLKGGVWYLGRNHVRLLPAVGFVWTPNPQTRWDIFFPEPRLSQYFTTLNEMDVWWYLGAEYGGGAWTIKREGGFSDRIDINDVRLSAGFEWGSPKSMESGIRLGFIEAGLVFDREIRYSVTPEENFSPKSTIFLRVGFGY